MPGLASGQQRGYGKPGRTITAKLECRSDRAGPNIEVMGSQKESEHVKALQFQAIGQVNLVEMAAPEVGADELLVDDYRIVEKHGLR